MGTRGTCENINELTIRMFTNGVSGSSESCMALLKEIKTASFQDIVVCNLHRPEDKQYQDRKTGQIYPPPAPVLQVTRLSQEEIDIFITESESPNTRISAAS